MHVGIEESRSRSILCEVLVRLMCQITFDRQTHRQTDVENLTPHLFFHQIMILQLSVQKCLTPIP